MLRLADEMGTFTVVDWATWLSFRAILSSTEVYVCGGDVLLNPCHAIIVAVREDYAPLRHYLQYILGEKGQKVIKQFEKNGSALFTPAAQTDFKEW